MIQPRVSSALVRVFGRGTGRRTLALSVFLVALSACNDSPTTPAPSSTLKATLAGVGSYSEVAGSVEIPVWSDLIRPKISLSKAGKEQSFLWRVARGTCAEPRAIVGKAADYPELKTDTAGVVTRTVNVAATLVADSAYHVSVHPKDKADTVAACGNLAKK